eukprot:CAMPEP_0206213192 /NCGR_PEP_ID=MMETSP0047_2-20121206/991_1 /ASSEMBLY_ACC=CAM_ASM_000192 /TAXON_ID=195065 /ORGANISM="Chroomonas mesostigmatica_cf, Strain CCMP1168" /LENGTH=66 /DNA_ID=CAMNT_0053635325 /DNA_START=12 /DNA_END=212 /DNA_ORIENTATION=-
MTAPEAPYPSLYPCWAMVSASAMCARMLASSLSVKAFSTFMPPCGGRKFIGQILPQESYCSRVLGA